MPPCQNHCKKTLKDFAAFYAGLPGFAGNYFYASRYEILYKPAS